MSLTWYVDKLLLCPVQVPPLRKKADWVSGSLTRRYSHIPFVLSWSQTYRTILDSSLTEKGNTFGEPSMNLIGCEYSPADTELSRSLGENTCIPPRGAGKRIVPCGKLGRRRRYGSIQGREESFPGASLWSISYIPVLPTIIYCFAVYLYVIESFPMCFCVAGP